MGTQLEGTKALRPPELPQGSTPPLSLEPGISLEERRHYLTEVTGTGLFSGLPGD